MAGIMRYVEPLPAPAAAKSRQNDARKSGMILLETEVTTPYEPMPIRTKHAAVIRAPPSLSESQPPSGRVSEPIRGPVKASVIVARPTLPRIGALGNCSLSTSGNAAEY